MPYATKMHFQLVADVMKATKPTNDGEVGLFKDQTAQWERTCLAFLNQFRSVNPSFDGDRFLKACTG